MELTQAQIDERIAVLRRFKALLEQQRDKFREYLHVLECQQDRIEEDDGDAIAAHAELEQQIVANISSLQKVILPIQDMYNAADKGDAYTCKTEIDEAHVRQMQSELADLQQRVLVQNERNRNLLKIHIEQIKKQLNDARGANPYHGRRSIYADSGKVESTFVIDA